MTGICTSHTHPHTQLKKSEITHTHTHTSQYRDFPLKRRRIRTIPTETSLFAISNKKVFIMRRQYNIDKRINKISFSSKVTRIVYFSS